MYRNSSIFKILLSSLTLVPAMASQFAMVAGAIPAEAAPVAAIEFPVPTLAQNNPLPAQPPYPACQPPKTGEYLVLVVSRTPESQARVRQALPPSLSATPCDYLGDTVTRVGGLTGPDSADAWAKHFRDTIGLSAFVAKPADAPLAQPPAPQAAAQPTAVPTASQAAAVPTAQPATTARPASSYNPQRLGSGYAVLVDFSNRPELAVQVQQALGKEIGLASYRQHPYLLAIYTTDQASANAALQALSDRGFWAMVVDSRRVTLLQAAIDTAALSR